MNQQLLSEYNRFVSTFKKGEKYTLFYLGEFGFPITLHATIENVFIKKYAQYDNALFIHYKPKRKRTVYQQVFYDYKTLYIWEGYKDISDNPYDSIEHKKDITIKTTLLSFDKRYIERALQSSNNKPDFILDRDYYTNLVESDFIYNIVFKDQKKHYNSKEELLSDCEMIGECESTVVRKELQKQPVLKGIGGGMWDGYHEGKASIRYECCNLSYEEYKNKYNKVEV